MSFGCPIFSYAIFWGLLLISLEYKKLMELGTFVLYCDFGSYGVRVVMVPMSLLLNDANFGSVSISLFLNGLILCLSVIIDISQRKQNEI